MGNTSAARVGAIAALIAGVVLVGLLLFRGGDSYKIQANFIDAGQLVKGGLVEVAGESIGTVSKLDVSPEGEAQVELNITDERYQPLHRGTLASIRLVGATGVANRYVEIRPGPSDAPEIEDGGELSSNETRPVVDLDSLLSSLDPPLRKRLQNLLRNSAKIYRGEGTAEAANRALVYLNPGLSQLRALSSELVRDREALSRLVRTGAQTSAALASRRGDVEQGISNTAETLRAVASESASVEDTLARAPDVLERGQNTLVNVRKALAQVNPALRELRPSAEPLAQVLRALAPAVQALQPVVRDTRAALPEATAALRPLPKLAKVAIPAARSTATALRDLLPTLEGLLPFVPDLGYGIIEGFGGQRGAYYDANGHYARILSLVGTETPLGLQALIDALTGPGALPALGGTRTGLTERCAGGAVEPAADGSNPFIPDPSMCNPAHDKR